MPCRFRSGARCQWPGVRLRVRAGARTPGGSGARGPGASGPGARGSKLRARASGGSGARRLRFRRLRRPRVPVVVEPFARPGRLPATSSVTAGLLVGQPAEDQAAAGTAQEQPDDEPAQIGRDPGPQGGQDADERVEEPLGGVDQGQQPAEQHDDRQQVAGHTLHADVQHDLQRRLHREQYLGPGQGEQQPAPERSAGPPVAEGGPQVPAPVAGHQQPDPLKRIFRPGSLNTPAVVA